MFTYIVFVITTRTAKVVIVQLAIGVEVEEEEAELVILREEWKIFRTILGLV